MTETHQEPVIVFQTQNDEFCSKLKREMAMHFGGCVCVCQRERPGHLVIFVSFIFRHGLPKLPRLNMNLLFLLLASRRARVIGVHPCSWFTVCFERGKLGKENLTNTLWSI